MKKTFLALLLIIATGLIAYANTFSVPFQFDDFNNISENPVIHNLANFLKDTSGFNHNPRRYLGHLSFALNYHFGGLAVTGYHIVNLAIHLLNAMLVYFLVMLTFRTPFFGRETLGVKREESGNQNQESQNGSRFTIYDPRFVALFSALLFVAHPVQTQAVTYIVQRLTSLATLFYLLSLVLYVKGRLSSRQAGRLASYFLSLVSAVLAMMTKEIAFTLPIMILLYEFLFFGASLKKKLLFLIPVLVTLAIIPLSMVHVDKPLGQVLSDLSEKTRVQTAISRGDYLMTEMRVIVDYLRLLFLPIGQNLDYDYRVYHSFFTPPVFLSFLLLLSIFGSAVYLLYKTRGAGSIPPHPPLSKGGTEGGADPISPSLFSIRYPRLAAFGILWFFLALSVESSLIPIVDVIFEHRLYLPSVGAFIAISSALYAALPALRRRLPGADKAVLALALAAVAALAAATYARNRVWQDPVTLWEDVVRKAPGNARAHNNLGFLYNARGMNDRAAEELLTALRLRPDYADAQINLGIVYNAEGMTDPAIEHFMIALRLKPDDPDVHNNLGIALVSKGMIDEAMWHYRTALKLKPDYPEAYNNMGVAYASKDMFDEAEGYFVRAISLKRDYIEAHYNLGLVYLKRKDLRNAEAEYMRLIGIDRKAAGKFLELMREARG
ncbi:MAG: tetratricopeptide repeat protein [Nitrospirae bacterium]|nr:tetratricopeptide repeat protein [Nitrospirota bacterium]